MYLDHFGLDEQPFRITPHTDFFFDGADRGTTLEGLLYAIQHDEGIVKVSGEVGSGKTMLCRVLMERLPENVETIYLANPSLTRDEILRAIAEDLKIETAGDSARVLMRELQEHLIESHARGRRVVILIDEAHAMPEDSLEQVRLLSNLETSRHKLLQIVLFGQPELDQMLASTSLRQLRDRITHSFQMRPLTQEEVIRYVNFRLRAAGYRGPPLFTRNAIALLTRASSGLTRRINILADKALLSAFALDTHAVDERHVQRAIADSELPPFASAKRPFAYVAAALVAGATKVKAMRRSLELGVRVETQRAFYQAQSTWKSIAVARQAVDQAEEGLRIVSNRYGSGLLTIVDLLDAQTALQQARTHLFKAMHDYRVARIELALAAGTITKDFQ